MATFTKEDMQEIKDLAASQKTEYRHAPLDTCDTPADVAKFQELDYKSNLSNEREN